MDQDFTGGLNGSPYSEDNKNRRSWGENNPYPTAPYPGADSPATQLPPIQTDRNSYNSTPTSYDPVRRPPPLPTTLGGPSFSPYAQTPQSPYGVPHYQNSPGLGGQFPAQMSPLGQPYTTSTYSPIRAMPALAPGQSFPYGVNLAFPQTEETEPQPGPRQQHVVGSQGRRGILPSDEGKPPAIINGTTGTKSTIIPQKDADGKFPCPHCQKTYLHGKHLKRHLLRHTGDRPYSCFLCHDTFSRSDILKRHFQKCSQRRGNPTGASHLAFSQNHLKRQAQKAKQEAQRAEAEGAAVKTEGGTQPATGTANDPFDESNMNSTMRDFHQHLTEAANKAYGDAGSGQLQSPGLRGPSQNFLAGQQGAGSLPSSGSTTPLTAKSNGQFPQSFETNASRPYSNANPRANQFENNGLEWSGYNQGKDSSGSVPSPIDMAAGQSNFQHSSDNQQDPFQTTMAQDFPEMGRATSNLRSIVVSQAQADELLLFCQFHDPTTSISDRLHQVFTPSNLEHFLEQYVKNFYQHFPLIHIPTFDPGNAYPGLILALVCTGAVYSDRLDIQEVRELTRKTGAAIKNSSLWLNDLTIQLDLNNNEQIDKVAEELHALVSVLSLSLWHGDDLQKKQTMADWSMCTGLALRLGFNEPADSNNPRFSLFHQPGDHEASPVAMFSYENWLWQEKRNRLMYITFLTDSVLAFFFNQLPTLDPMQLRIPLPCDDAAWEALNAEDCAKELGFFGPGTQTSNITGSLRKKQPEMHLALAVLEKHGLELSSRSTNAPGKFILIHGLLVHLWTAQRFSTISTAAADVAVDDLDWVNGSKTECASSARNPLNIVEFAAEKWIKAWDHDVSLEFPSGTERKGYSRDGVHYYWLIKLLIQNCDLINVHSSWNDRQSQILQTLKNIGRFVSANQMVRGESTGTVSLVDERYGLDDLTKDLKLLLAPL